MCVLAVLTVAGLYLRCAALNLTIRQFWEHRLAKLYRFYMRCIKDTEIDFHWMQAAVASAFEGLGLGLGSSINFMSQANGRAVLWPPYFLD